MNFWKSIFRKEEPINTYDDFWNWFKTKEKAFHKIVKSGHEIENDFFIKVSPKLDQLKDGIYLLTGMYNDHVAELVLTAEGDIKNIVFVEDLVNTAPKIPNWKFTALKPALDIENIGIKMEGYTFDSAKLNFYPIEHQEYPDEIDILITYDDYNETNKTISNNGVYIFLDNYLGELNSATSIDNLSVISKEQAEKELIPIIKLKDYLIWRDKEFVEKYNETLYNTENDSYASLEAELENGNPIIAIINSTVLNWDGKASHPWILVVEIKYESNGNNGMPKDDTYKLLEKIEEEIIADLKDIDGYLNIGRQTGDNERLIYFACKEFRKPSKILHELTSKYSNKLGIQYDIYKDKYWQTFERFKRT